MLIYNLASTIYSSAECQPSCPPANMDCYNYWVFQSTVPDVCRVSETSWVDNSSAVTETPCTPIPSAHLGIPSSNDENKLNVKTATKDNGRKRPRRSRAGYDRRVKLGFQSLKAALFVDEKMTRARALEVAVERITFLEKERNKSREINI